MGIVPEYHQISTGSLLKTASLSVQLHVVKLCTLNGHRRLCTSIKPYYIYVSVYDLSTLPSDIP